MAMVSWIIWELRLMKNAINAYLLANSVILREEEEEEEDD